MKANVLILLLSISVLLTACGKEEQKAMPSENMDTVIILEETSVKESELPENSVEKSEYILHTTEEEVGEDQTVQQYTDAGIYYEYPLEWVRTEERGEDGCRVRILNPDEEDGAVFELVQGEAWRVNLDYTKEDYVQFLSEKYAGLEIIDLAAISIDGYDAKKLQFIYEENEQKCVGTKYMVIVDLVSFEMTYVYPFEKAKEYEKQGEEVIESIRFS